MTTMNETLEAIRQSKRVARMRMGQEVADYAALKSNPEVRVALVPLMEKEYQQALEAAASWDVPDNAYGTEVRDRTLQVYTLLYAIRQVGNESERVFSSIEQMLDPDTGLEAVDVNYLSEFYTRMVEHSSPAYDGLDNEQLDALKKALVTIDWNALSGRCWWHLKGVFSTLPVGLPLDNSPSASSILSWIGRSAEEEFTPGAKSSSLTSQKDDE